MRLDADACRRNSRNLLTISGKPMGFSVIVVLDEVPTSTPAGSFTPALQPCPIDCWYASPVNRARAEAPRASLSPGNLRSPRNRSDWRHAVARTRAVPAATSRYTPDCRFGLSFQPATAATTRKAPHAAQRDATTYTAWKTSRRRNQLVSISMRSSSGPTTPWQTLANRCSTNSRGSYRTGADNNTLIGAAGALSRAAYSGEQKCCRRVVFPAPRGPETPMLPPGIDPISCSTSCCASEGSGAAEC